MTLYSVPPLFGSVLFSLLALFILSSKPRSISKLLLGLLCFETTLWQICWLVSFYIRIPIYISLVAKIAYLSITFLPFTFYHFISTFIEKKQITRSVMLFYSIGLILVSLLFTTDLYVAGYREFTWGNFASAGPMYPIFMIVAIISLILGLIRLLSAVKGNPKYAIDQNQGKYLLAGMIFYALCAVDFPQVYGAQWYPVGTFFFLTSFSIITYAITKHNLLDIEVIIRRASVFAGLFAFVYGVFTATTVLSQSFFQSALHWNQWIAMIPTVIVITFALRPLEIYLTNVTERFLFQKKYDYRELLRTFTNEILTVLDLQRLTDQTVAGLLKIIKLESAGMMLFDKDQKTYKLVSAQGVKDKVVCLKEDDLLVHYLKESRQHILQDKSVEKMEGDGELKQTFKRLNAKLCLPIELHDNLIGIMCLGMKKSGEDFTQEDIDILTTLSRTEAIAISNAQLFDELSKTQAEAAQREKMAVIGTLAAGINHEICNPLGIVRGQCEMFLLNLRDGLYDIKDKEEMVRISSEIMNKVIKETDRATAITKKLSSFAKPSKRSEMEEVRVDKEVDEVLGLIGHDMKLSNITVKKDFIADFPAILADKKQIEEVLFNIIRNAAQAMDKSEGEIVVSGRTDNGSVVVKIKDNASGIPPEKVSQIFHPFYTTKAPGKGTGLGLFIVKQVVEKNQGSIEVESQLGVGTIFTLKFPRAQAAVLAA